jgi:hypothetical protein
VDKVTPVAMAPMNLQVVAVVPVRRDQTGLVREPRELVALDCLMTLPASRRGMLAVVAAAEGIRAMPAVLAETAEVARAAPPTRASGAPVVLPVPAAAVAEEVGQVEPMAVLAAPASSSSDTPMPHSVLRLL